ncbi:hypothetical protein B0E33_13525 [Roseibium algicola]|jgi:hypothetical protein|uniref:Uncharacterized protein n=1 Tax=Roseibium algicola TaxID=2857014 RepID=A0ABM6I2F9_9HYPH|nr:MULTISPECIES: hypothetical protein [Stappiaceae]AQQ04478.1 hypothetical protein B0E33_13525 [Roseibium aggregatum]NKX64311.1 hypothetical protein [Labrenzia sp. 5N]
MFKFLPKIRLKTIAGAAALSAVAVMAFAPAASAESPFHTGVWQLNTPEGPRGLVVSDWLVFENGLPKRWLYRRAGTNDANQFDFFTRSMNDSGYTPVGIRVYRTGDNAMKYTLAPKGEDPIEVSAVRLSIPNFENSCLSVEKKGKRFYGNWVGTEGSKLKKLNVSKNRLTIDGEARKVSIAEVRVGRMGITENGKPIAFLTDAGGDYAVLQWFKPGVTVEQMQDPDKEILDFASEEIVRNPGGTCDRQIESRLKAMK